MPDVGTPQATWRTDLTLWAPLAAPELDEVPAGVLVRLMEVAVAARDREVAATLRAKIEALFDLADEGAEYNLGFRNAIHDALAVLDAVLGGDS